jgi:hypothetical protein
MAAKRWWRERRRWVAYATPATARRLTAAVAMMVFIRRPSDRNVSLPCLSVPRRVYERPLTARATRRRFLPGETGRRADMKLRWWLYALLGRFVLKAARRALARRTRTAL